ncbi:flavin-containing monooxygenase [Streptomyces sp. NPDC051452]|uniref:flavin-containing monooxygenase n=1 Tax=Streptomyces sp. NPDC051452 TaxID=3365654 RepID=UPI003788B696
MGVNSEFAPITAADDVIRAHLESAEIPALLMAVAHLTGDVTFLGDYSGPSGWLTLPQGGLTPEQQSAARELALRALVRHRDGGSVAPPPPGPELLHAITSWAMGEDAEELLPLIAEEVTAPGADPKAPGWNLRDLAPDSDMRVGIIGAGMSGLLAAHRLAQAGVPFEIYEKNSDVGGTWFANRYPGCRVDVPSHLYSYSFATRTDWPEYFCTQDVLLEYFRDVAKRFGLYDHIRFGTEVREAAWDEERGRWSLALDTPDGPERVECTVLVSAVGQLSRPSLPAIPGRDTFRGPAFHSARWDHSVELAGRRVGVIGTGASAFQFIPEIAEETAELRVFQRTPPWLRPTSHYHEPVPPGARWLFEHVPYYADWYRFWLFAPGLRGVLEAWIVDRAYPPTERAVSALNEKMRVALTRALESQLTDAPELLPGVLPRYPVGAKRVLRDNGSWIRTLKRDDVTLVSDAIEEITPTGVRTADGRHHELDVLVYGTGFEASRFLMPMKVTGRDGVDLHTMWGGSARAYLGLTIPGFPNLFCLYGPNTNLSGQGGSIFYFSECGTTYLLDALRLLLTGGHRSLEPRREVYEEYNARVDEANAERAWGFSSVSNWTFDRAAGRSAQNWPFTTLEYWTRTRRVRPGEYHLR